MPHTEPSKEQREKAYNQGCMWGMSGGKSEQCPYAADNPLAAWWFQGWEAGMEAWHERNLNADNAKHA